MLSFNKFNYKVKNIFGIAFSLFLFLNVSAQDSGNQILKSLQDKFNSLKDLSADVKQVTNGKTIFSGKAYFKKENKFRFEFKNNTLVTDGSTTWNYNKKENKVVIDVYDESNPSSLSLSTIINDYPSRSDVTLTNEGGKKVLILTPKKNSGLNFSKVMLQVNDDNLADKISVIQSGGNTVDILISNYKLNQNLSDSLFSFNPPEGTTVIDLR